MSKCAKGTLSGGIYPYVETPKSSTKTATEEWSGFSNSGTQWDYTSTMDALQVPEKSSKMDGTSKKTILVFILGDITFAEMRCAYEVSNALNVNVYIGGTAVTTPSKLIDMLKHCRTNASYL
ncbi:Sec1 family protein [Cardiosporidium cionae]|uniref:Sec1 family protein n=1 Tax=Cardiosporidium cionae TaxID=476202 RepID=A0ABQ7J4N3_9APIC|nr:Sec1 family protein [Cardiosporidium cionae]|eukprot:KAF8818521.1 Sec1 family protein [Cardiosporidium cionae]